MDNQRTLLFGREQWCLASNVGQFRQAFMILITSDLALIYRDNSWLQDKGTLKTAHRNWCSKTATEALHLLFVQLLLMSRGNRNDFFFSAQLSGCQTYLLDNWAFCFTDSSTDIDSITFFVFQLGIASMYKKQALRSGCLMVIVCFLCFFEIHMLFTEIDYALIKRVRGPYEEIFLLTFKARSVRASWMSEQIFRIWTELSVNKSFIVYLVK